MILKFSCQQHDEETQNNEYLPFTDIIAKFDTDKSI